MRKLVVPALPTASIPDPERGDCLPPEGRVVAWTAHWARLTLREDVTVAEPPAEPLHEPEADRLDAPEPDAAPAEPAAPTESAEAGHHA